MPLPALAHEGDEPPSTVQPATRFTHVTTEDGLSQSAITAILQDSRGFVWIGTEDGLNRYDGYNSVVYRHDPTDPNSLSNNHVRDVIEDRDGHLWIATDGGVNRFDPYTEYFTRYQHDPENPNSLSGNEIHTVFQDRTGNLWFGGLPHVGLNRYEPKTDTFTHYLSASDSSANRPTLPVKAIVEDHSGYLWLVAGGLIRLDPSTGEAVTYLPGGDQRILWDLVQEADGSLWVTAGTGLYHFDPGAETFSTFYPGVDSLADVLYLDADGEIWAGTVASGLYRFDPRTRQFTDHYVHDVADVDGLSDDRVTALFQDDAGVLWIGTTDAGLNLYDPRTWQFTHYPFADQSVHALCGDPSGAAWLNFQSAIARFDPASGQVTDYTPVPGGKGSRGPGIDAIFCGRQGDVWFGWQTRIARLDPDSGHVTEYDPMPLYEEPASVTGFGQDPSGALWIGIFPLGIFRLDPDRETFEPYLYDLSAAPETNQALSGGLVTAILSDREGDVWIGYQDAGVSRYDPASETFAHYRPAPGDPDRFPQAAVETIFEDEAGTLWFGTRDGLVRLDQEAAVFTLYGEADGLANSFVVSIQQDGREGALWLSTKKGLSRFDPEAETFTNYDRADGLGGNEFNTGAAWRAPDGRLFFGGNHGLTAFYPDQVHANQYQPPIVLTELRLHNKTVEVGGAETEEEAFRLPCPIWATEQLELQHDQDIVSFEFAALSYAAPHKNHYRYRLEGFEDDWNYVDSTRRFATYTNLPPGHYVLRVQGTNDDGVWSDREAVLQLTVVPPWWQTWWFRGAMLVLLIGLVVGGVRWRVRALRQRSRFLEVQVAQRTEELNEKNRFLQNVLDSLTHPFYVIDARSRTVEMANAAARAGELHSEPTCYALIHQDDHPCEAAELPCPLQEIKRTKEPVMVEHVHVAPDGSHRDVEVHGFPILDREGNVVQMIEYVIDVTERKRTEERVRQNEVRLAALEERERIGRELHDDLGQVIGYLDVQAQAALVRLEQGQVPQAQAILAQLAQAAQTAQGDVRQYILGIRHQPGIRTSGGFFAALGQFLSALRVRYGLETQVSWPDDLVDHVLALQVEEQLLRIIQEALTNVCKHAGVESAWVVFTLHADEVQVIVEDNGCGFDPDQVLAASGSPATEHFGLAIMRERAEGVGGSVEVHSKPGAGTRVIIRLPRSLVPALREELEQGVRVLLVDDHRLYLEGLRTLLVSRGLDVVGQASDGMEAMEQARELQPDLILMDVQMPRCNGVEATRRIKAEFPAIQIVMLTMAADGELLFEALKSGASGYLLKSLEGGQFFDLLARALEGETVLSPDLANRVLAEFAQREAKPSPKRAPEPDITPRQREVLERVAQGLTNKEIAAALHITERTVKYHVSQILERLRMKSRYELARYAQQQGMVPSSEEEAGSRAPETR